MSIHEYAAKLRDVIEEVDMFSPGGPCQLPMIDPCQCKACRRDRRLAVLALPIPTDEQELLPMSEAPRDGTRILALDPDGYIRTVVWSKDWEAWNCTGLHMTGLKGWIPLPKVKR